MNQQCFFHVDLDAFFASVEQLDNPALKGKCVIVGGLPSDRRSVVSTCSYEARRFGVHSAMPIAEAKRLCQNAIFLRGNHKRYSEKSEEVMECFKSYSPTIIQISIDEAFLDLSGTEKLFGNPTSTARKLKNDVKEKTGLTVSVGVASNMYLAKIASGMKKPDGLFVIPRTGANAGKFMVGNTDGCGSNKACEFIRDYMNTGSSENDGKPNNFEDPDGISYSLTITPNWGVVAAAAVTTGTTSQLSANSDGNYTITNNSGNAYDAHMIYIIPGGRCVGDTVTSSTKNPFAILYRLEGAGTYCIDDQ